MMTMMMMTMRMSGKTAASVCEKGTCIAEDPENEDDNDHDHDHDDNHAENQGYDDNDEDEKVDKQHLWEKNMHS